ncbi:TfoX/Sxy family protein [Ruminococcus flavefaciens]|uniref:TfoX-like protein n=1 Tax=Ruminococcus flavefaciens TaxID=1265 RepID=A0A315Y3B8_RUMFL|nr:TfoX/Sxy family protein [Ruminococcus flavefaciens]PWJ15156.1 TfoX-like protein [Ruminococcus flavefaciens]SSA40180.1 TfoX N-terminal domain-containing protein [Ruminococcus flavefaciens]
MASSKDYLNFILEQLSELDGITYRAMMGEFIIYYQNKIIGGVYDDRLLVKDVRSARELMPDAPLELPYDGAKKMILVTEVDDKDFLNNLITSVYEELPAKKNK